MQCMHAMNVWHTVIIHPCMHAMYACNECMTQCNYTCMNIVTGVFVCIDFGVPPPMPSHVYTWMNVYNFRKQIHIKMHSFSMTKGAKNQKVSAQTLRPLVEGLYFTIPEYNSPARRLIQLLWRCNSIYNAFVISESKTYTNVSVFVFQNVQKINTIWSQTLCASAEYLSVVPIDKIQSNFVVATDKYCLNLCCACLCPYFVHPWLKLGRFT